MANIEAQKRLQRLQAFIVQDPENQALLTDASETALLAGEPSLALSLLEKAEKFGAASTRLAQGRALAYLALGRFELAADTFSELRSALPADPDIRYGLANAQASLGNFEMAWYSLLGIEPNTADPAISAILAMIQAIADRDQRAAAFSVRVLHHLGRLEDAAELGAHLLPLYENAADLRGALAALHIDLGHFPEAGALADEALSLDPAQPEALVAKGLTAMNAGALSDARLYFEHAQASNPISGRASLGNAMVALLDKQYAQAEQGFRAALDQMPTHLGTWHALAWAQLCQGKHTESEETLSHALSLNANFSETHGMQAILAILKGDNDEANAAMRRAVGLDRHSMSGRYAQYLLLQKRGAEARAKQLLESMLTQTSSDGRSLRERLITMVAGKKSGE